VACTLEKLLSVLDNYELDGSPGVLIRGVTDDSRLVRPGWLFICFTGEHVSGYDYIEGACQKGAAALLADKAVDGLPDGAAVVRVPDAKAAARKIAPYFYNYPSLNMRLFGVTGTNGKTTVTYMLKSIFDALGKTTGVIGTIETLVGGEHIPARNTTPDSVELQSLLSAMREKNVEYVFMEVSSHALALDRIAGCEFDTAILTNVTRDHLDFHKDFNSYLNAKTRLFSALSGNKHKKGRAVINRDDQNAETFLRVTKVPILSYGFSASNDVYPKESRLLAKSMELKLATPAGDIELRPAAAGRFNIYNVMAAVAAAVAEGAPLAAIEAGLNAFKGVSGRFELVEAGQPFTVVVDYAHTPDGLENILKSAREIAEGRLITVFGCGGDRDKTKRPLMGALAVELSDSVYVTSDNPRREDPEAIIADIMAGIAAPGKARQITDRAAAIKEALSEASAGDAVVIAGKGHETYQILKDKTIDFDDRLVAGDFLRGIYR
jgi:UDP-N-acetylmuramyl-tripeptide synthetase